MKNYIELDEEQAKQVVNTQQLFAAYQETLAALSHYQGYMVWKKVGGKEYLYHLKGTSGNGKSLGRREPEREGKKIHFDAKKAELRERLAELSNRLQRQAKINKALRIGRLPNIARDILQVFEEHGLSRNFPVLGTHCLFAYEAMAGVQLLSNLTTTEDIDLLWDSSRRMKVFSTLPARSLIDLLKRADKSFRKYGNFSAVNQKGFYVDFIRTEAVPPWKPTRKKPFEDENDIEPSPIASQEWIISSPKAKQTVIAQNGLPIDITVPDPRSFVLHTLWLSEQDDRPNIKKKRDRLQALTVAGIIKEFLPHYSFSREQIRMFPKKIAEVGLLQLEGELSE